LKKRVFVSRVLLALYLVFLVWIVVLKMNFSFQNIRPVREVNLIPFYYKDIAAGDIPLLEALMNVIVFIPFGFLLTRSLPTTGMAKKVAIIITVSLIFEILQYALSIGASDITDVITNSMGGITGVFLGGKVKGKGSHKTR